jgi:hypothetical protein
MKENANSRPILVKVQHAMVEHHSQFLLHLLFDPLKDRRPLVVHVDRVTAVLDRELRVGSISRDLTTLRHRFAVDLERGTIPCRR